MRGSIAVLRDAQPKAGLALGADSTGNDRRMPMLAVAVEGPLITVLSS
jgi:hypothetical protein